MFFSLRQIGEGEWDMNRTMLSAPATSHKGRSEAGKGAGSCCEVSCFKVVRTRYREGIQGGQSKASGLSGQKVGLRYQTLPLAQAVEGVWEQWWWWPALEKEGGGGVRWRLWNQIWSTAMGLGAIGGGLQSEGSKEEDKSEQRSGDIVLGGCGPEWAKSI